MLTKKDLQVKFSLSMSTINKYMKEGMPFHKIGTGQKLVRFKEEEVQEWLMNKR